jgi:uncharacterized membrane protein YeaQ/YmgE (transglycosylase-associated protein family)
MGFFVSIIVGILAGFIAEKVMKSNGGLWTNLFVGIVGGMLGWWVVGLLGLTYIQRDGFVDSVVVSACGAVLLLAIWRAIRGRKPA